MKQKMSKREIFKLSAVISGTICLFAVLVIGIITNYSPTIKYGIPNTAEAYYESSWLLIDSTDSYNDCVDSAPNGLGGSFSAGTCTLSSDVTITDKTLIISNGGSLNANNHLTIQFTSNPDPSVSQQMAMVIYGALPGDPVYTASADGVIIDANNYVDYGVLIEGNGTALSNTTISDTQRSGILISRNASNFNLQSNTTTGGPKGVEVRQWASSSGTGEINYQNSSGHSEFGIEMYGTGPSSGTGTAAIEITNSNLTNNDVGLYIHDAVWSAVYANDPILGTPNATIDTTDNYVSNNTITSNTTYDIWVDVAVTSPADGDSGNDAWADTQSTSASNTYNTLYEESGSFPEAPSVNPNPEPAPPASVLPASDTFDLSVEVNSYQSVTNSCSDALNLTPTTHLSAKDGARFGKASCNIEIIHNDPTKKFNVLVAKTQPGQISDGTYNFADIENTGNTDCLMDTSGNTEDEEFGYRLDNVSLVSGVGTNMDGECGTIVVHPTYDQVYGTPPDNYYFDIEYETGDPVIASSGTSPYPTCLSGQCTFDLTVGANVDWNTYADTTYSQFSTGGNYTVKVLTSVIP